MEFKNILTVFVVLSIGSSQLANSDSDVDPVASIPRLVMVYYTYNDIVGHIRGTLVKPDEVIVPAHCVLGKNPKHLVVVGGTTLLYYGGVNRTVVEMLIDETYNSTTQQNDYALLKLDHPFVEEHRGTLDLCPALPKVNQPKMPSTTKFNFQMPKQPKIGDKVIITGTLKSNVTQFSINFVVENAEAPTNIAYQFTYVLKSNLIIQEYKMNDEWRNHVEERAYLYFYNNIFSLEFVFLNDEFRVYEVDGNYITAYERQFYYGDIKSINVWGDVEKIKNVTFLYT